MASTNINVRFQSFVLGGVLIPAHGNGASPRIDFEAPGVIARGIATDSRVITANQGATAALAMWKEDDAFEVLLRLMNAQKFDVPTPNLGGSATAEDGLRVVWDDAVFIGTPSFILGEAQEIVTFTLGLTNARYDTSAL